MTFQAPGRGAAHIRPELNFLDAHAKTFGTGARLIEAEGTASNASASPAEDGPPWSLELEKRRQHLHPYLHPYIPPHRTERAEFVRRVMGRARLFRDRNAAVGHRRNAGGNEDYDSVRRCTASVNSVPARRRCNGVQRRPPDPVPACPSRYRHPDHPPLRLCAR